MTIPTRRLDALDQTFSPERDHEVAAMRDGISNKLRVEQILALLQTSDIPDAAVTLAKLADDARAASGHTFDDTTAQLGETDVQGAIEATKALVDSFEQIEIASTAEAQAGTDNAKAITPLRLREGLNAFGTAPVFACRAWVNFNGGVSSGGIRASGNVSSVTRLSTGEFQINFEESLTENSYAVVAMANRGGITPLICGVKGASFGSSETVSSVRIDITNNGGSSTNPTACSVIVVI